MKEYDENEAIAAMMASLAVEHCNEDAVYEILDIIYEYYEANGDLDISMDDDDDDEIDLDAMLAAVRKELRRHPAGVDFTDDEIVAMIKAEMNYQDSLL